MVQGCYWIWQNARRCFWVFVDPLEALVRSFLLQSWFRWIIGYITQWKLYSYSGSVIVLSLLFSTLLCLVLHYAYYQWKRNQLKRNVGTSATTKITYFGFVKENVIGWKAKIARGTQESDCVWVLVCVVSLWFLICVVLSDIVSKK
jgi:hypothetical protein